MKKNPPLRFLAKIMLNSFWGKLAQSRNKRQTEIIKNCQEYFKIVNDERKEMKGELMINDDTLLVNWKFSDETNCNLSDNNLAVASFVTAYARIELYRLLDKIENIRPGSVFYFDTDSVIFVLKQTDETIPTGEFLGELKNEITDEYGEEAFITKVTAIGPKIMHMKLCIKIANL